MTKLNDAYNAWYNTALLDVSKKLKKEEWRSVPYKNWLERGLEIVESYIDPDLRDSLDDGCFR
jgi:hypothetical protein